MQDPQEISDGEINHIIRLLEAHGIYVSHFKKDFLKRRVKARILNTGAKNVNEYYALLKRSFEEAKALLDSSFINVSEFFRDPPLWVELQRVLGEILGGKNFVRIWSAACSCGEEPYSIAMLVSEVSSNTNREGNNANVNADANTNMNISMNVEIIATDVDEGALRTAANGLYDKKSLKNVPPHLLYKYFVKEKEKGDVYRISPKLKEMVSFMRHDVVRDRVFTNCDLLLCRNLMIYFPQEIQEKLIEKLWTALKPGGYLVIGMSEVLSRNSLQYFEPYNARLRIYRRRAACDYNRLNALTKDNMLQLNVRVENPRF
jgi:chemotaxis protein methyltransferase CheR